MNPDTTRMTIMTNHMSEDEAGILINVDDETHFTLAPNATPVDFKGCGAFPYAFDMTRTAVAPLMLDVDCSVCKGRDPNAQCNGFDSKVAAAAVRKVLGTTLRWVAQKREGCLTSRHIYFIGTFITPMAYGPFIKQVVEELATPLSKLPYVSAYIDAPLCQPLPFCSKQGKAFINEHDEVGDDCSALYWPPCNGSLIVMTRRHESKTDANKHFGKLVRKMRVVSHKKSKYISNTLYEFLQVEAMRDEQRNAAAAAEEDADVVATCQYYLSNVFNTNWDGVTPLNCNATFFIERGWKLEPPPNTRHPADVYCAHILNRLEQDFYREDASNKLNFNHAAWVKTPDMQILYLIILKLVECYKNKPISTDIDDDSAVQEVFSGFQQMCSHDDYGYAMHFICGVAMTMLEAKDAVLVEGEFRNVLTTLAVFAIVMGDTTLENLIVKLWNKLSMPDAIISTYGRNPADILDGCLFLVKKKVYTDLTPSTLFPPDTPPDALKRLFTNIVDECFAITKIDNAFMVFDPIKSYIPIKCSPLEAIMAHLKSEKVKNDVLVPILNQAVRNPGQVGTQVSSFYIPVPLGLFCCYTESYCRGHPQLVFSKTIKTGPNPVLMCADQDPCSNLPLHELNKKVEQEIDYIHGGLNILKYNWPDVLILLAVYTSLLHMIKEQNLRTRQIVDSVTQAFRMVDFTRPTDKMTSSMYYSTVIYNRLPYAKASHWMAILRCLGEDGYQWTSSSTLDKYQNLAFDEHATLTMKAYLTQPISVNGNTITFTFEGEDIVVPIYAPYMANVIHCALLAQSIITVGEVNVTFELYKKQASLEDKNALAQILERRIEGTNKRAWSNTCDAKRAKKDRYMNGPALLMWAMYTVNKAPGEQMPEFLDHEPHPKFLPLFALLYQVMVMFSFSMPLFFDFWQDAALILQPTNPRKAIMVLSGFTLSGKSTLCRILSGSLEPLFLQYDRRLHLSEGTGSQPEKMHLNDCYMCIVSECVRIDSDQVKPLTGGDARHSRNHQDRDMTLLKNTPFLLFVTNLHNIYIDNCDLAMENRLRPYNLTMEFDPVNATGILLCDAAYSKFPAADVSETSMESLAMSMLVCFMGRHMKMKPDGRLRMNYTSSVGRRAMALVSLNMETLRFLQVLGYYLDQTRTNLVDLAALKQEAALYIAARASNNSMALMQPFFTGKARRGRKGNAAALFNDADTFIEKLCEDAKPFIRGDAMYLTRDRDLATDIHVEDQIITIEDFDINYSENGKLIDDYFARRRFSEAAKQKISNNELDCIVEELKLMQGVPPDGRLHDFVVQFRQLSL